MDAPADMAKPQSLPWLTGDVGARLSAWGEAQGGFGPPEAWPTALQNAVGLILGSGFPMFVVWGPERILIYNDAYIPILSGKHPAALGHSFWKVWPEVRPQIEPVIEAAFAGRASFFEDLEVALNRHGHPEPAWFTFAYSPIHDADGERPAALCVCVETTSAVLAREQAWGSERRQARMLEQARFLDVLGSEVAALADADAILARTTELVGKHLGGAICAYADMDEDQDGFTIRGDWTAPGSRSIVGHYSLADFGVLAVRNLSAGLPLVVNDVVTDLAPEEAATFQSIGIGSTICMPLVKDDRLTALMAVHDTGPRVWTAEELSLIREVTERSWAHVERVGAAAELRASEENFRTLAQAMPDHVWSATPDGMLDWFNDKVYAYTGASAGELDGVGWTSVVHPDDLPQARAEWAKSLATGGPYQTEFRLRQADGAYRWHITRAAPVRGQFGHVTRWVGTNTDIEDQKEAARTLAELNATLRESEAFQRGITEATPECIKVVGPEGEVLQMNPAGLGIIEANNLGAVSGSDMAGYVAPEHREAWIANHRRVLAGERVSWEFDVTGLRGRRRSMETHAVPLKLPHGAVAQLSVTRDVTERKKAEEHLKLMVLELNHRVKNNLATVQAIAMQTLRGSEPPEVQRDALVRRIKALAVAHDILTREQWDGVGVAEIALGVLQPLEGAGGRIELSGAKARLTPKAALALSMAFHELGTNALKYGALSSDGGRVRIEWTADDAALDRLSLSWVETGGPLVQAPASRGFGSRLLERGLASEFDGRIVMSFDPAGLRCDIEGSMLTGD